MALDVHRHLSTKNKRDYCGSFSIFERKKISRLFKKNVRQRISLRVSPPKLPPNTHALGRVIVKKLFFVNDASHFIHHSVLHVEEEYRVQALQGVFFGFPEEDSADNVDHSLIG